MLWQRGSKWLLGPALSVQLLQRCLLFLVVSHQLHLSVTRVWLCLHPGARLCSWGACSNCTNTVL